MRKALLTLSDRDPMLAGLYEKYGEPPLWNRPESFATLVHIILEQKVSLKSAQAVLDRVEALCPGLQASAFMTVPEDELRNAGLSARKVTYCRSVAEALISASLSLPRLKMLSDEDVISTLTSVKGIGPWTAGVYLMMALRRPDAWASGDRALAVSYSECAKLDNVPSYKDLDTIATRWMPHRATAARLLWHAYLEQRRLKSTRRNVASET